MNSDYCFYYDGNNHLRLVPTKNLNQEHDVILVFSVYTFTNTFSFEAIHQLTEITTNPFYYQNFSKTIRYVYLIK